MTFRLDADVDRNNVFVHGLFFLILSKRLQSLLTTLQGIHLLSEGKHHGIEPHWYDADPVAGKPSCEQNLHV
jgi:hypothetical protein